MPPPMAILVLSGDYAKPTTMANDRQPLPMTSYWHSVVTTALSRFVFEIMVTWRKLFDIKNTLATSGHLPRSQVWPCVSIASGTALAFCCWTHQIPTGRTGVWSPAWHGSRVPGKRPSMGRQYRVSTAFPLVIHSATDRTKDQIFHCRRPCFWWRCCSYLEQFTFDSDHCWNIQ